MNRISNHSRTPADETCHELKNHKQYIYNTSNLESWLKKTLDKYGVSFVIGVGESQVLPQKKIPASMLTIASITSMTYTGKTLKPSLSVKYAGTKMKSNRDYKISYSNNVKAGTAKVKITGIGKISGSVTKTFKIAKAKNPLTVKTATTSIKASKVKNKAQTLTDAIKVTKKEGAVTFTKVANGSSKNLTINKKSGKIKIAKGAKKGTYKIKVKVKAAGNKNYKDLTKTITVIVKVK